MAERKNRSQARRTATGSPPIEPREQNRTTESAGIPKITETTVSTFAKIATATGRKLRGTGIATLWGALGEAVGQATGFFLHLPPDKLGHASGLIAWSICGILLSRAKPISLKDCLRGVARLRKENLITDEEYLSRRAHCLTNHEY